MPYFQYALLGNWDNSIVKYYPSCTDGSCAVAYDVAAGLCASSHTECASNPFSTTPAPTVAPTPGPYATADAGAYRDAYAWTQPEADASPYTSTRRSDQSARLRADA